MTWRDFVHGVREILFDRALIPAWLFLAAVVAAQVFAGR